MTVEAASRTRPRYAEYRDSGVGWLSEVPAHWEVARLRHSVERLDEKVEANEANRGPYVGLEHVESWTGRLLPLDEDLMPEGLSNRFGPGDVLFGKLRPYLAKAFSADFEGLCSGEFLTMRPTNYHRGYLLYVLLTDGFVSLVNSSTYGAKMPRANWEFVGSAPLPVPPLAEQQAIAAFLDRETARADTLIEKKRLLIERLEEQRTALISRTVTRGLPPEAARAANLDRSPRLKPSGVEWLGEVPEHWEVLPLRRAILLQRGHDLPAEQREDGGVTLVTSAGPSGSHSQAVAVGPAIVTGRYGSIGAFYLVTGPFWPLNTTLYSIDLRGNEPRFLRYALMHLSPLFLVNAAKSAVPGVDRNDLHPVETAVPPRPEQEAIANFLDGEMERTAILARAVEHAIERLKEYRTALITAAVTGKIDVRELAREALAAK